MRKLILNIVYFLALVFFTAYDLSATNWYVSTTSSGDGSGSSWANKDDWATFNWASVNAGDIVNLDGHTDSLTYSFNSYAISGLAGTAGNNITIKRSTDASHNGIVIWQNSGADLLNLDDCAYLIIDGIKLKGATALTTNNWLIYFTGTSNNITIQNCFFWLDRSCGIDIEGANHRIIITNNDFRAYTDTGTDVISTDMIWVGSATAYDIEITYNTFITDNPQTGGSGAHRDIIQFANGYGSTTEDTTLIHHNYFNDIAAGCAMACVEGYNMGGVYYVYDNVFKSNATGASSSGQASLYSNTDVDDGMEMKMYNNTFYSTTTYATPVLLLGMDSLDFRNNIVYAPLQNYEIMNLDNETQAGVGVCNYNQYYSTTTNFVYGYGGTDHTWASWQSAGNDLNSTFRTDSPDFVSLTGLEATDYALQLGSDGINDGTTISLVTDDYSGVSRPQGSAYDLGAFEYQTGAPPSGNGGLLKSSNGKPVLQPNGRMVIVR